MIYPEQQYTAKDIKDIHSLIPLGGLPAGSFSEQLLNFPHATKYFTINLNRYKDILPNKEHRVIQEGLVTIDNKGNKYCHDYFNGSYISVPSIIDTKNTIIATQCPTNSTIGHFWKVVYCKKIDCIIWLSSGKDLTEIENGSSGSKFDKYYPDLNNQINYEEIIVKTINVIEMRKGIIKRKLEIMKNGCKRTVTHLQYYKWEDGCCPESSSDIKTLISSIHREGIQTEPNLLVHCSAGVGRTGTFIAIYLLSLMADKKGKDTNHEITPCTVMSLVAALRTCRMSMVATPEQFLFINEYFNIVDS
jgi:protein tyrosine phosphatase